MECLCYHDPGQLNTRRWAFVPPLFHSPAYLLNKFNPGELFSFTIEKNEEIYGIIHFSKSADGFQSMGRSPFGGFAAATRLPDEVFRRLVESIIQELQGGNISIFFPFMNYPEVPQEGLKEALMESGFRTAFTDLQQYLMLRDKDGLLNGVHRSQRRKLRKCYDAGFSFREEPLSKLLEIHRFIAVCRHGQGLQVNISGEELLSSSRKMPGIYRGFTVRHGEQIIAACITSHVSSQVLYYYLPASAASYRSWSPMVMLLYELALWAFSRGYSILDLGKSSLNGVRQEGLATFKSRMGAMDGDRVCLTFENN